MVRFLLPLVLISSVRSIQFHPSLLHSAASEGQIRFALENKYDDTGPGATQPEYAYKTYASLDDALVGFIDDPDTKLPDADRERAIKILTLPNGEIVTDGKQPGFKRYYPKTVEEYTGGTKKAQNPFRQKVKVPVITKLSLPKKFYQQYYEGTGLFEERVRPSVEKSRVKPLRVEYHQDPDLQAAHDQFDAHPKYSYSYGVHVPDTGDSKSAQETRNGGSVQGFYSFMDPDGQQRTVHYTADDVLGFRAVVDRGVH